MRTFVESNGAFEDERFIATFDASRALMTTRKVSMMAEAPGLLQSKLRHPNGGTYLSAYRKAMSKFEEMEARESKFTPTLNVYIVQAGTHSAIRASAQPGSSPGTSPGYDLADAGARVLRGLGLEGRRADALAAKGTCRMCLGSIACSRCA